jgi:SAM-dependent methyltransferase
MRIRTHEADTYAEMWGVTQYDEVSPGEKYLPIFTDMAACQLAKLFPPEEAYRIENLTPSMFTVLDAGCGAGKGTLALQRDGYQVVGCDITDVGMRDSGRSFPFVQACLWEDLSQKVDAPFDWVYCCDVLEHIPIPFTMLTVRWLLDVARHGAFFSISLVPDVFGVWVGQPLHQSVPTVTWKVEAHHNPFTWWRDALGEVGTVVEARDLMTTGLYLVAPR